MSNDKNNKKKEKEENAIEPSSKAPVRVRHPTDGGVEYSPVPGMPMEITPEKGITLQTKSAKDLKVGETLNVVSREMGDLSIIDSRFAITEVEPDGSLRLKKIAVQDTSSDPALSKKLARAFVEEHRDVIAEEATKAVEQAMKRKEPDVLQGFYDEAGKGRKITVTSRRGCMYLNCGRASVLL